MINEFTENAKEILNLAKKESKALGHGYIGSEHILLGILDCSECAAAKLLFDNGVDRDRLLELINDLVAPEQSILIAESNKMTPRAQRVLDNALKEAKRFKCKLAGSEHILIALLKEWDSVAVRLLTTIGANIQKLYAELLALMGLNAQEIQNEFQALTSRNTDNADSNATPFLDSFSRDLTKLAAQGKNDPVIGREHEINRVIQILSRRTKNNPCLVGEPGVGKTAIVEGIANKIASGDISPDLVDTRLVSLDLAAMVAGSKYRGEFEERVKNVIKEVSNAKNVILFIDEIHTLIGAGGAEGSLDAAGILKPAMARGEIRIIGATTQDEYRKYIEKDTALERRFQPVNVEEATEEETVEILKGIRKVYEDFHNVDISDEAIEEAVRLSVRYINDRFLPDKAIDVIDEAMAKTKLSRNNTRRVNNINKKEEEISAAELKIVELIKEGKLEEAGKLQTEKEKMEKSFERSVKRFYDSPSGKRQSIDKLTIAEVVSDWTKIPTNDLSKSDMVRLNNLEKILHERVISQDEAVASVSKAIKRGRTGLKDPARPIGSFLFLGPTGVGKTELSKALAEAVFGSEEALIRVDMSEYMEKHSVSKMIGSPPGYVGHDDGGQLSEKVKRNPYSVILLDEIEKAHPDVFNILLQVLDDGHITDSHGRKVSFKNTIIIMTSNIGANQIVKPKNLGFTVNDDAESNYKNMKDKVMNEVKKLFKPEMLNRIDEILVFHQLDKNDIIKIAELLLDSLGKRMKEQMDIKITFNKSAKEFIADKGYDISYGARPLKRAIQTNVEDVLADKILGGELKEGDSVSVTATDDNLEFKVSRPKKTATKKKTTTKKSK